ncbi:hypothetical protein ACVW0Y_004147 [Pseudomonas sp. TE3786]
MQDVPILTSEELDFIQDLQTSARLPGPAQTPSLRVDGGAQIKALLTRLAASDQLTIEAHFNGERVTFPLQLVEDEFHSLSLEIGLPQVVEPGESERSWRLHLKPAIALLDEHGKPSGVWLHSLSTTGLLVEIRHRLVPNNFTLWLPQSGAEPIRLQGILARRTEQRLVAYRLSGRKTVHSERLRQYIYQQHRLLNQLEPAF